jgi:hypothetical protein
LLQQGGTTEVNKGGRLRKNSAKDYDSSPIFTQRSDSTQKRRHPIVEVIDQWYGPGYRYVKVKGYDRNVYILRFDQIRDSWDLIMFSSERAPRLSTGAA